MEWCKLYDIDYIENDIIGTIQELLPENDELINEMSLKATGLRISKEESGQKTAQKKTTIPDPFELTVPKPRVVPIPEEVDRTITAEPVNPSSTGTPWRGSRRRTPRGGRRSRARRSPSTQ